MGRWLLTPLAAVLFVAGVLVTGGLITDDFRVSMALTAVWFVAFTAGALIVGRRRPAARAPVLAGFAVAAVAAAAVLGPATIRDRVVDESVAVAGKDGTVALAEGPIESEEHASRGRAAIVRKADGSRVLTLTGFETSAGPDLRVRIVPGDNSDGGMEGAVDLGGLKGNRGDQQYDVPDDVLARAELSVVIWCRAFSVAFARAKLVT
jgi:hypothetical protein